MSLAAKERRPNLLVILSDDQGYAQMGAFSDLYSAKRLPADSVAKLEKGKKGMLAKHLAVAQGCMPELDKLAKKSIRVTHFRAAHTCAPSRMMLMSGIYPQRSGVYTNLDMNRIGAPRELPFLVKNLSDEGYRTALVGKWHLGLEDGQHPLDKGFGYFFGFDSPGTKKYNSTSLLRGRKAAKAEGYLPDQMTAEALRFIEDDSAPFFLYLAYNEPHGPLPKPPEQYLEPSVLDEKSNYFYGAIRAMDHGIGRVIAKLEETGRLDDTLVVFASDNGATNGAPLPRNGEFRGGKRTVFEGALRVPMLMHFPPLIKAKRDYSETVTMADIMPTFLDLAGIKVPDGLDGRSLLPVLKGSDKPIRDSAFFWASETKLLTPEADAAFKKWRRENSAKKPGTRLWHSAGRPAAWVACKGRWKAVKAQGYPIWLYDLKEDPSESKDVSKAHPKVLAELEAEYRAWIGEMKKPVKWYDEKWQALQVKSSDGQKPPKQMSFPTVETRTWTEVETARKEFAGFDLLGEYAKEGEGIQVTAGEGKFYLSRFRGGLPGAGWDGNHASHQWIEADAVAEMLTGFTRVDRSVKNGAGSRPPEGAVVLFDGSNTKEWKGGKIEAGLLQAGTTTRRKFRDFHLYFEYMLPLKPDLPVSHPHRGNSGVFALGAYEVQLSDTFGLDLREDQWEAEGMLKYPNTACGSIYGLRTADVNMCLPPLVWQRCEIKFTAARFDADGKKQSDARITVVQNGVNVHNDVALSRGTGGGPKGPRAEVAEGTIQFQNHGSPTQFRNIWILER